MTILIRMTLNNLLNFKSEVLNLEPKLIYDSLYSLYEQLKKEKYTLSHKDASILNDLYKNVCKQLKLKYETELDFMNFVE